MITYRLSCAHGCGHIYDSSFKDMTTYNKLASANLLECPQCGSHRVEKALMAPAISKVSKTEKKELEVKESLRNLRRKLEEVGENVGSQFAQEARAIHNGQAEERLIYGSANRDEVKKMQDDGIPISEIPWVPLEDA